MSANKKIKLEWLLPHATFLFESENGVWCTICKSEFVCRGQAHIDRHVYGPQHVKKTESIPGPSQPKETDDDVDTTAFCLDLCEAFVAADIPLYKLTHPRLKQFFAKYCHHSVPDESTLRKKYADKVYVNTVRKIQQRLSGTKLWFSIDETTDIKGRSVANVIAAPLNSTQSEQSFLISSKLIPKTNHETITETAKESLYSLFPETHYLQENVVLFLSDSAAYMLKAGKKLKEHFPNILHVTCFAHGVHRICEVIREYYPVIDTLISEVKKIFLKSPSRINSFKEMCPNIPLPPQPVITRWGTWLLAVKYYNTHFDTVKTVVDSLKDDAQSVKKCKNIVRDPSIKKDLKFINTHFGYIPEIIEKLETQNLPLVQSFSLFDTTIEKLKSVPGDIGQKLKLYIPKALERNPGYIQLKNIVNELQSENSTAYEHFRYAPVTSCDVERSFSRLRDIENYKRASFTAENLEKILIISCNAKHM